MPDAMLTRYVLMNLLVNCSHQFFVLGTRDGLVVNRRSDTFMDGSVIVAALGHEIGHGFPGGIHCSL